MASPEKSWCLGKFASGHAALDREQLQAFRFAAQELGANAVGYNVWRQRGTVEPTPGLGPQRPHR